MWRAVPLRAAVSCMACMQGQGLGHHMHGDMRVRVKIRVRVRVREGRRSSRDLQQVSPVCNGDLGDPEIGPRIIRVIKNRGFTSYTGAYRPRKGSGWNWIGPFPHHVAAVRWPHDVHDLMHERMGPGPTQP